MSYLALATNDFEEMVHFYGDKLGFPVVAQWDRPRGRGTRFDLRGGLRLEILDNTREPDPRHLGVADDRVHIVVEVDDIVSAHAALPFDAPTPTAVSWGAQLFELRDPSGVPVTFLQWDNGIRSQP